MARGPSAVSVERSCRGHLLTIKLSGSGFNVQGIMDLGYRELRALRPKRATARVLRTESF